jgi:hypothetical protein
VSVVSYVGFHVLGPTFVAVIMARRPFEAIKDIHDGKSLWRIAVLVKDLWVVRHGKSSKQHMELVVRDKLVKSWDINIFLMSCVCLFLFKMKGVDQQRVQSNLRHSLNKMKGVDQQFRPSCA